MRRLPITLCIVAVALCPACGTSTPESAMTLAPASTAALEVGGLYASPTEDGQEYLISKVLAIEPGVVHVRFYAERFPELPTTLSSTDLTVAVGHAPMSSESSRGRLLTVEPVEEAELEGYRYYQEAMRQ